MPTAPSKKKPPAKPKAAPAETPPPKPKKGERPIVHDTLDVLKFWTDPHDKDAKGPMTLEIIDGILGWEEETEEVKFGNDFLFKDRRGNKVRCTKNLKNRPLEWAQVDNLAQIMLNRRWAGPECMPGKSINGEPIIIDKYDDLHEGQHTLIAAKIAEQDRTETDANGNLTAAAKHWQTKWPNPITVDKLVVIGIDGSDDVVNTINTGRPRKLEDVIYRSETFAKYAPHDRKTLARMLSVAVKTLWDRTGAKDNAWAPIMNHAESLEFVANHKRLEKAVVHIFEEDKGAKRIGQHVNPGVAAGLMYLMAASNADGEKYRKTGEFTERKAGITDETWKRAEMFWTLVPDALEFKEVRIALAYAADSSTGMGGTYREKVDIFARAWEAFADGFALTEGCCYPHYATNPEGKRYLIERPTFGGIDVAPDEEEPVEQTDDTPAVPEGAPDDGNGVPDADEPTEEQRTEIEARKKKATAPKTEPSDDGPQLDAAAVLLLRGEHKGKVLIAVEDDFCRAYASDAKKVKDLQFGFVTEERAGGAKVAVFGEDHLQEVLDALTGDNAVAVVRPGANGPVVEDC